MKVEQRNQELWLQGLYNYNAFATVLANAFGKRGGKKHKYLEKPIQLSQKSEAELEQERMKETNRVVNTLNLIAANFAAKNGGKEGKANGD